MVARKSRETRAAAAATAPTPWPRRARVGGNVALQILLCLALLGGLNTWAFWNSWRFDLTADQRYVIPPETKQLLRGLDRRIDVVIPFSFGPNRLDSIRSAVFERAVGVCKEFELLNPSFRLEAVVNIGTDVEGWSRLRSDERRPIEDFNQIYLFCGERREVVSIADLADIERPTSQSPRAEPKLRSQRVVEALSTAVQRVTTRGRPRILFSAGSGEIALNDRTADWSVAAFGRALRDRGYQIDSIDLRIADEIPSDTALLVIIAGGAQGFDPLTGPRRQKVLRYLDAGGRLLLFNPLRAISGLEARLRDIGILPDPSGLIIDPPASRLDPRRPQLLRVSYFDERHPITQGFRVGEFMVEIPACVPLQVEEPAQGILHSDRGCWLERGRNLKRDADEPTGPFALVAVYEPTADAPETACGRVAVFGSWMPPLDGAFRGTTRRLVLNTVYWLTDRVDLAAEPGKPAQVVRVPLTDGSRRAFFWTCVFLLPLCSMGTGLVVYWRRRR